MRTRTRRRVCRPLRWGGRVGSTGWVARRDVGCDEVGDRTADIDVGNDQASGSAV